jgi:tetratricopeptide (TPR) repeat protein
MESATAVLARTLEIALQHRELAIAVEAGARKIYTEGMLHADLAALKRDADFLLPLSLGLPGDRFARPLLLNNVGSVYQAAGDRAQALRYFQAAHDALLGGRDNLDPELTCVDVNLASFTVDPAAREALVRDSWTWLDSHLGPANLATLNALSSYARLTVDPARALPLLGRACDAYATQHPGLIELRTYCESYRAFLAEQLGDPDEALRIYDGIIAAGRQTREEDVLARATLATGAAALLRGDLHGAALAWQKLSGDARNPHWWIRVRAAHAAVGLGTVSRLLRRDSDAAAHFERAIGTYREVAQLNEESEYRIRLALAQAGLDAVRREQRPPAMGLKKP